MIPATEQDWNLLLAQAQSGSREAQATFFSNLAVTLRPILQSRLRGWSRDDQEDVLQETLIVVAHKLNEIHSTPDRFALAILRNKIGDALRSQRSRRFIRLDITTDRELGLLREIEAAIAQSRPQQNLEAVAVNEDLLQRLRQAIQQLSLFCQTFFLGILEQRTMNELWTYFKSCEPGLRAGAFRKRIYQCRMKLKALLQEPIR